MKNMSNIFLQILRLVFVAICCTFKLVTQTLYLVFLIRELVFVLGIFDLHKFNCLCMSGKNIFKSMLMLSGVLFFKPVYFLIFL